MLIYFDHFGLKFVIIIMNLCVVRGGCSAGAKLFSLGYLATLTFTIVYNFFSIFRLCKLNIKETFKNNKGSNFFFDVKLHDIL